MCGLFAVLAVVYASTPSGYTPQQYILTVWVLELTRVDLTTYFHWESWECKQVSCSCGSNGSDEAGSEQWNSVPNMSSPLHSEQASLQWLEQSTNHFSQLKVNSHKSLNGVTLLEITHGKKHSYPPAGFIYRVRLVIACKAEEYHYNKQVLLVTIEEGHFTTEEFMMLCSSMHRCNGYVFCLGLSYSEYMERYNSVIWFHSKQVSIMEAPFKQIHARGYLWWFKLQKNATIEKKGADKVCCSFCKRLCYDLEHLRKKSLQVSPARRANWQAANSDYLIKYLSPTSSEKQKTNTYKQTI